MNISQSLFERIQSPWWIGGLMLLAIASFAGFSRWAEQQKSLLELLKQEVQTLQDCIAKESEAIKTPVEAGKLKKWVDGETALEAVLKLVQEKAQKKSFLADIKEYRPPEKVIPQGDLSVALYTIHLEHVASPNSGFQDLLALLKELADIEQKIDVASLDIQAPQKEGMKTAQLILSIWIKNHA